MKHQYVNELAVGSRVDCAFMLSSREMRVTRTGEAFLAVELADRSGRIPGVLFRPPATAVAVPVGTVARITGTVTAYRGVKRVSIELMSAAEAYAIEDMLASGRRAREELVADLRALASRVRNRELRSLLSAIFGDTEFFERFITSPGGQHHHHAYVGGLAEHTVAVASICSDLGELYPEVDMDVLIAAALLHDIGKVDELTCTPSIEYTEEGRLIGHVVLGERRVHAAASGGSRPMSRGVYSRLSHALLSHHGELEWGSPKRPSTVEALLLHHADNLDAKASGFLEIAGRASAAQETWTDTDNLFRRPLYAPAALEGGGSTRPREDDEFLAAAS